ncbi:FecR family protein [Pedobacter sp. PACM 27299]|uniref:FecR family protein n=1 Tax=Pedobacter sp. PACM 27299 TaxID=1727164 RepID=UPI0018D06DA5|nr:FecR family protein [Pedobacter sp. PACM 27299]
MNKDRIEHLFHLYLDGSCTSAELDELKLGLMNPDNEADLNDSLDRIWDDMKQKEQADLSKERAKALFENIVSQPQKNKINLPIWKTMAAAAVLLITLSTALFFYFESNPEINHSAKSAVLSFPDAAPGGNKALLTLPGGEVINLSSDQEGLRVKGDQLIYADGSTVINGQHKKGLGIQNQLAQVTGYAEFRTPIGGKYEIILSDGTKVLLNANSKLRYPVQFSPKSRIVELEGEGYFEVSKSKEHPFIVRSRGQEVKVLGTEFNISSYDDNEAVKTTLLNGSVKLSRSIGKEGAGENIVLKPGQQSEWNLNRSGIRVREVDVTEVMDWKEGLFLFNDEPIKEIMKRVARWYDVEVVYAGNMDNIRFVGSYSRNKNLKNLLKNIELTGKVVFKVEFDSNGKERRIMVKANY